MTRVIVICEGPTEAQFCKELLYTHFIGLEIIIQWTLTEWSQGGQIAWGKLKKQIIATLKQDSTAYVTTFIDLYGLYKPDLFPNWAEALSLKSDPYQRIALLEEGMKNALPDSIRHRFIPNIVLHEFEGLLFNDIAHFENLYNDEDFKNKQELIRVLSTFDNPELINETKINAPSHRLKDRILKRYSKTIDGILIALDIELYKMRQKSQHFNQWIEKLEQLND